MKIYPEFQKIKGLLERAKYGISFNKDSNFTIRTRIKRILKINDKLERLLECIKILALMSNSTDIRLLDKESTESAPFQYGDNRIMKVLNMLSTNYTDNINLSDISNQYGMNKSAFCRYFKEKTGKPLIQYVNELRIGNACKLLLTGELSISQICYNCGYKTIANFNRHFKLITGFNPSEYILQFRKDMRPIIVNEN
jgi:AraC-like DNA-binding protein